MEKKPIDIRVRLKVSDSSLEALLDEYLHSDGAPYPMREMVIVPLLSYWLPLIYQAQGATPEKVRQSLVNANYRWQLHLQYLQERTGILLEEFPASARQSAPSQEEEFNSRTDAALEQNEAEEEGEYPELFEFTSKF